MPADHENSHPTSREGRSSARLAGVIVCAVLAICSAIVAGTAWTRPTLTPSTIPYSQVGQLSYSAPSSPTSIYGSRGLTTGQAAGPLRARRTHLRHLADRGGGDHLRSGRDHRVRGFQRRSHELPGIGPLPGGRGDFRE